MNLKTTLATTLILLATTVPAMAHTHRVLSQVVHLDVTVGDTQQRTLVHNETNISSVNARLSSQLNRRLNVYIDGTESYVNRGSSVAVASTQYSAVTGDVGARWALTKSTTLTAEAGNAVNNQMVLPGEHTTNPYVGLALTQRVF